MTDAAADLEKIDLALGSANASAAAPTTELAAAAADEVSATIAALFGWHGKEYQALSKQVAAVHERLVQHVSASAGAYATAEAANASLLQPLIASDGSINTAAGAAVDFSNPLDLLLGLPVLLLVFAPGLLFLPIGLLTLPFWIGFLANG